MKTLFIGLNWIGDLIMSFPAISAAAIRGKRKVDILTRPHLAELYSFHPGVGTAFGLDNRSLLRSLPAIRALRQHQYDRIIVLPNSFRAALTAFACGSSRRVGYVGQLRGLLLHRAVENPENLVKIHESSLHLALVQEAGFDAFESPLPTPVIPEAEKRETLRSFGLREDSPFALFAPGAAFGPAKRWPADRFLKLGREVIETMGYRVVLTGGRDDRAVNASIAGAIGSTALDLAGKTSLTQLVHLIRSAAIVFANDSGTMHLAALTKTPVVVPVGPTDMTMTGPMSAMAAIVSGETCPIQPCRKRNCQRADHLCMNSISPEAVLNAARELLIRRGAL